MEWTVILDIDTNLPLTTNQIDTLAELGGSCTAETGGRTYNVTLTAEADQAADALATATTKVLETAAGAIIAAEVLTADEADRRLEAPAFPELVGITEIAELLEVSRQRAHKLAQRDDFPEPVARLASGPIWRRDDLGTFAQGWQRQPGRPRKAS